MEDFPKKYTPKDLRTRSKLYKEKHNIERDKDTIFSSSILCDYKKLLYHDFFLVYLKDFFGKISFSDPKQSRKIEINDLYEHLFTVY